MIGLNNKYAVVSGWAPVDKTTTAVSDIISLKNYNQAEIYLMTGAAIGQAFNVALYQGVSVSSCATLLPFTRYYESGMMLKYDGASSSVAAASGGTVAGAGGAAATIYEDRGGVLVLNKWDADVFVDNEALTFSNGKTAVVDGTLYNEDAMIPTILTAGVDLFAIATTDTSKMYCIPVNGGMLTDGNDCIAVHLATPATATLMDCFVVLSEPRFSGTPMPTAIYD